MDEELNKIDDLFDANKLEETIKLLKELKVENDSDRVQILWRLARSLYQLSKTISVKSERVEMVRKGLEYATQAIKIDDNSAKANIWYAVLLDEASDLQSFRERVIKLRETKAYMVRACELDKSDALSRYILGMLVFTLADLSWIKRKILETVFATPPDSSYSEALDLFLTAENIEPGFYSVNKLMIAKCYIALKDIEMAKEYLVKASELKIIKNHDDVKCVQEAKSMLSKYK